VKIINTGPVEFPLLASVVPADPRRFNRPAFNRFL